MKWNGSLKIPFSDPKSTEKYLQIQFDRRIQDEYIKRLEIETPRINISDSSSDVYEQESCLWFAYDAYGYGYSFSVNQIRESDGHVLNTTRLPGTILSYLVE